MTEDIWRQIENDILDQYLNDESPRPWIIAFSGGKDSTVMTHLVMDEAIKRGKKVGLLIIDLEAQYSDTISHILTDEIQGVKIPYLKPELLIKTKMGVRPKDVQDRDYLQELMKRKKESQQKR